MTLDSTSVASISALAATARNLFRRAKISGPDFADVAAVVRSLHTVLKHMRSEAEDPDSLLNSTQQESSLYARQLTPIVEDTDFTLKQLDTILEKYGSYPTHEDANGNGGRHIEDRERDMLNLIRSKLANQKTNIDIFLDTVQLHNPSRQHQPVDLEKADDRQQNSIKDKIDAVAQRLFQRRAKARVMGDVVDGSEEEMWQQFWSELVIEGFSSDVLRKHKEVLRAYIRELEENGSVDDEPPSVRGLLDSSAYAPQYAQGPRQHNGWSHKELVSPAIDNEKFAPGVKLARGHPEQYNRHAPASMPPQLSYERYSSDTASETDSHGSQQLALISTQDLMEFDRQDADNLAARASALQLSPALHPAPSSYGISPAKSGCGRYLPPPSTFQGQPNYPPEDLSSSPANQTLGSSPRYPPTYGASPASSVATPPPAYSATIQPAGSAPLASSVPTTASGFPPPPTGTTTRRSRLAPDSKGAEIPLDAKWTRIKRTLVSPEVLEKAGFRYEARPDFVAVLGELSKDDIAHLAHKTAEVRATRGRGYSDADRKPRITTYHPEKRSGNAKRSSRYSDETDDEDESVSSNPIWDDSDSDSDSRDSGSRSREGRGSATDKYIPRDVRRQKEYRHRRHDSATIIQEEPDLEDVEGDGHSRRGKSGRSYHPVIVAPPSNDKVSPASTVPPKPILKNRNENHVRFDEDGTPRELSANELDRERRRERRRREGRDGEERRRKEKDRGDRDRDRERDRDRDREDRDRGDRDRGDRDRERERHRDRDIRDRDHHYSSSNRHRERDDTRERRRTKKSVWGETLGAVGIGGAAVSLLSVLTEAAAGF